jgi:uncharacterized protein (DUF1697 family)
LESVALRCRASLRYLKNLAPVALEASLPAVIFCSIAHRGSSRRLEAEASQHFETALGYNVDVFIRTLDCVTRIAREKHFSEDGKEGNTIHVGFLHEPLADEVAKTLEAVVTPIDQIKVAGCEFYWLVRSERSSDSQVWTLPKIRALRLPSSTMRNIKTIRKLADVEKS